MLAAQPGPACPRLDPEDRARSIGTPPYPDLLPRAHSRDMNLPHADFADSYHANQGHAGSSAEALPTEPITGWHALVGLPIGIVPQQGGPGIEVSITGAFELSHDLAVADRVAWVLAGRTGVEHVVLATDAGYLVATVDPALDWAGAMRVQNYEHAPRVVSVATGEGVLPVLLPMTG